TLPAPCQCARRMEPGRSQRSLLGPLFVLLSELGTRCLRALEQPILSSAANIIMEQAPVAESLRLPLATQGGEPWALKKTPTHLRWRVMAPRSQSSSAIS